MASLDLAEEGVGPLKGPALHWVKNRMHLTVRLPEGLARLLKQTALNEDKPVSALTAEALAL
jgi:hypothetical protein